MPKREDDTLRNVLYGGHPPACNCAECTKRRLKTYRKGSRRKQAVGRFWRTLPKALILVFVLAVAAIVVVTVCQFITGDLNLLSVALFSASGLAMAIWGLRTMSRYRVSFTRFFIVLLVSFIFVMVSIVYLGIRSPVDVKDNVIRALATETEEFRSSVDLMVQRAELTVVELTSTAQEAERGPTEIAATEGSVKESDVSYVSIGWGVLIGADGNYIELVNNPDARNPSWAELKAFLLKDKTDSRRYDLASFVCADFAEMIHNNAEEAGIRAAYVSLQLGPCTYYPFGGGHTLNAFETTDRGLVYIDCTGCEYSINADKIVKVKVGRDYVPRSIFPEPGWDSVWYSMGEVKEIEVIQW